MKRILFCLLLVAACLNCSAQSIEKRYSSTITNQGTIHFFRPKKLGKVDNMDSFSFDMTYLAGRDSLTLNCSIALTSEAMVNTLAMKSERMTVEGHQRHMLFRDVTKKGYVLRVSSVFAYKDIKALFAKTTPLVFQITLSNGQTCTATYKDSQWKRESEQVTRIFNSFIY